MAELEIEYSYSLYLKEEFKPKAIIYFRPHRKWDGEFGFDWVRNGDTNWGDEDNPFTDYPFEDIVGFYGAGTDENYEIVYKEASDRTAVLKALLQTCKTLNIRSKEENISVYYVPKMTIMKDMDAKLDLYIECEEEVDRIEFIIKNNNESIILDKVEIENVKSGKAEVQLLISCKDWFNEICTIEAQAFSKEGSGSLCGRLDILPNSEKYQKKIDILLIQVKTNLNGKVVFTDLDKVNETIEKFLNQALLIPTIETYSIELLDQEFYDYFSAYIKEATDNITFLSNGKISKGTLILSHSNAAVMTNHIVNVLSEKIPKRYNKYYKVFLLEELAYLGLNTGEPSPQDLGGGSLPGNPYNICCYGGGTEPVTVTHEIFHSLGLKHLFYKLGQRFEKYKFKTKYTSNIMDYFTTRISTFYWQWKILNRKIK